MPKCAGTTPEAPNCSPKTFCEITTVHTSVIVSSKQLSYRVHYELQSQMRCCASSLRLATKSCQVSESHLFTKHVGC